MPLRTILLSAATLLALAASTSPPAVEAGARLSLHTAPSIAAVAYLAAVPVSHPPATGHPPAGPGSVRHHWLVRLMVILLYAVIALICVYLVRHVAFTLNRLFAVQRHPYLDVDTAAWPGVTVLIPAHNEEEVIGEILGALLEADYPRDRLRVIAIDDRSKDRTGEIVDAFAARHPDLITALHRRNGNGGKGAALQEAMALVEHDIVLVFDADYIPGHGLIRQLAAPFFDPEVGAVMGRVVPNNVGENILTRVLDLERSGGYQVDQQARMNLRLVPQYGGTVGGVRRRALESVGGWRADTLAEDTDATLRLLLRGWKTAYQNRSECYEQVPSTWPVRMRQLHRWARGHNQVLFRYFGSLLRSRCTSAREKLDGMLLLGVYLMSPVVLFGWLLAIVLWYLGITKPGLIVILAVTSYSALGNFAIFFEVAAAAHLDGTRERVRLLPFMLLGFLVNLLSVTRAAVTEVANGNGNGKEVRWHKTERNNHNRTKTWV